MRPRSTRHSLRSPSRIAVAAAVAALAVIGSLFAASPATATPADMGIAKAAAVVGFDPEDIISDALFYDGSAMTSEEIQRFLDAKIGTCRTDRCLNVLRVTATSKDAYYSQTTGNLVCAAMTGGNMRVSELIYRVQVSCGISAKVILVTLQKEQGLVTSTAPEDRELRAAMGHLCSDSAPCDASAAGIANQIFGGAEQLKKYKATAFGKQPGTNWIGYNPDTKCGGTYLNIRNFATAALYNYTPYQPNPAAIAAGQGLGDICSSYGNRNFHVYYRSWFGSTHYPQTDTPFVDVSTVATSPVYSVFAADIVWVAANGISAGWTVAPGAQEYRPTAAVTRDVMAAFLYRLSGSPAYSPPAVSPFVDVPVTSVFYKEIAWLASTGTSEGWATGGVSEFRPTEAVTRDVMATFIYRLAGEPSFTPPTQSSFRDVSVDDTFYPQIAWLAATGISSGWASAGGTEFRPTAAVTRDVMAAFLHRAHTYLNPFADVASMTSSKSYSVFAPDIAWLSAAGISQGWATSSGVREYRPALAVSRDVMAAFLYRLAGSPTYTPTAVSPFVDVSPAQAFYKEISWLAEQGISEGWQGLKGREFRPFQPVTRDVMAAFLYRMAGSPSFEPPTTSPFADVAPGAPFYKEISWMSSAEISMGWSVSTTVSEYRPYQNVARDVMAAFLQRLDRLQLTPTR